MNKFVSLAWLKNIFVYLTLLGCNASIAATLQSLIVQEQGNKTTVTCRLYGAFTHKVFTLSNPDRVVVDFTQTNMPININQVPLKSSLITHARVGHPDPRTLRLVLDSRAAINIHPMIVSLANAKELRIDIVKKYNSGGLSMPVKTALVKRLSKPQYRPVYANRDVIIVIDPGHGGKDPGARGPSHTNEKEVVLNIARRLKQQIDRQPGMRAVLTRNGDYYVGLRERLNIARKLNADIFVSIHADAFINHNSNGASVFALSPTGATSEAARWLAEKENYSELGGVDLSELDDRNGMIRSVLIDLSQTATIGSSLQMGHYVLRNLDKMTTLHTGRVEQARFMVLKSPDIPSILVETGFISNPREERNLNSASYQVQLTQALFSGIKGYFWSNPPRGTKLEALSNVQRRLAHS